MAELAHGETGTAGNRPEYRCITLAPLTGALGAEVGNVDLASVDDETVGELRRALDEHLVLFFRDQSLTPSGHVALGRRFGKLNIHPFVEGLPDHPEIIEIVKEPDEGFNWGGGWHSDVSFLDEPSMGSILFGRQVPPHGGDTLFANMQLAYDTLSDGLKRLLAGLRAVHRSGDAARYADGYDGMKRRGEGEITVEHPVVRSHPDTGRKSLFVNRLFTHCFAGMSAEESRPLLGYLFDHAERPAFTCRFRWRENSVAFWDNRFVIHNAVADYHPERVPGVRRVMHRVTVNGERPA